MLVKLFTKSTPTAQRGKKTDELELEINSWLEGNPTIEILNVAQSFGGGGTGAQELVISVWYRDSQEVARRKLSGTEQRERPALPPGGKAAPGPAAGTPVGSPPVSSRQTPGSALPPTTPAVTPAPTSSS